MKVAIVVLLAALTAKSLSGQVALGGHFGPVASKDGGDDNVRLGIFAGVSAEFDLARDIRTGAFYVQKGSGCCPALHYVEVPVLFKFRLDDLSYLLVGPAVGYLYDEGRRWDVGAVAALGIEMSRSEQLAIMLEASFNYGLLGPGGLDDIGPGDEANRAFSLGVRLVPLEEGHGRNVISDLHNVKQR